MNMSRSALILVDVQNDFCPGGKLGIENADQVVKPLNRLSSLFAERSRPVVASQDWHPEDHVSFASSHQNKKPGDILDSAEIKGQVLWPNHCVQGTKGADFHAELDLRPVNLIVRKGYRSALDSYSAFFENDRKTSTGLDAYLKSFSIDTLVLGGLATDYCVLYSALDAAALGYKTVIAADAVMAVNIPQGSGERALELLREAGVIITESSEIK